MCSSDRPPSPSSTMNNLSLSSLGCTGKLLRKISVKRVEEKKVFVYTHTHTHTLNAFLLTGNLPTYDEKSPDAFGRQKKSPKHNYLCLQVLGVYLQVDSYYIKSELMRILFHLITLACCIGEAETGHEYSELQQHLNKWSKVLITVKQLCFASEVPGSIA